jgi:alpha-ketoglutarate-dependent dioxygenase alkB family protein 2
MKLCIGESVRPWSDMPILKLFEQMIEKETGQAYHTCVLQLYPDGNSGIKPHRDKEMSPETIVASLSLGCTRTMRFEKSGSCSTEQKIDILLSPGTLCLINPPTNNYWLHSIPVSPDLSINTPRISLVYRNTIAY